MQILQTKIRKKSKICFSKFIFPQSRCSNSKQDYSKVVQSIQRTRPQLKSSKAQFKQKIRSLSKNRILSKLSSSSTKFLSSITSKHKKQCDLMKVNRCASKFQKNTLSKQFKNKKKQRALSQSQLNYISPQDTRLNTLQYLNSNKQPQKVSNDDQIYLINVRQQNKFDEIKQLRERQLYREFQQMSESDFKQPILMSKLYIIQTPQQVQKQYMKDIELVISRRNPTIIQFSQAQNQNLFSESSVSETQISKINDRHDQRLDSVIDKLYLNNKNLMKRRRRSDQPKKVQKNTQKLLQMACYKIHQQRKEIKQNHIIFQERDDRKILFFNNNFNKNRSVFHKIKKILIKSVVQENKLQKYGFIFYVWIQINQQLILRTINWERIKKNIKKESLRLDMQKNKRFIRVKNSSFAITENMSQWQKRIYQIVYDIFIKEESKNRNVYFQQLQQESQQKIEIIRPSRKSKTNKTLLQKEQKRKTIYYIKQNNSNQQSQQQSSQIDIPQYENSKSITNLIKFIQDYTGLEHTCIGKKCIQLEGYNKNKTVNHKYPSNSFFTIYIFKQKFYFGYLFEHSQDKNVIKRTIIDLNRVDYIYLEQAGLTENQQQSIVIFYQPETKLQIAQLKPIVFSQLRKLDYKSKYLKESYIKEEVRSNNSLQFQNPIKFKQAQKQLMYDDCDDSSMSFQYQQRKFKSQWSQTIIIYDQKIQNIIKYHKSCNYGVKVNQKNVIQNYTDKYGYAIESRQSHNTIKQYILTVINPLKTQRYFIKDQFQFEKLLILNLPFHLNKMLSNFYHHLLFLNLQRQKDKIQRRQGNKYVVIKDKIFKTDILFDDNKVAIKFTNLKTSKIQKYECSKQYYDSIVTELMKTNQIYDIQPNCSQLIKLNLIEMFVNLLKRKKKTVYSSFRITQNKYLIFTSTNQQQQKKNFSNAFYINHICENYEGQIISKRLKKISLGIYIIITIYKLPHYDLNEVKFYVPKSKINYICQYNPHKQSLQLFLQKSIQYFKQTCLKSLIEMQMKKYHKRLRVQYSHLYSANSKIKIVGRKSNRQVIKLPLPGTNQSTKINISFRNTGRFLKITNFQFQQLIKISISELCTQSLIFTNNNNFLIRVSYRENSNSSSSDTNKIESLEKQNQKIQKSKKEILYIKIFKQNQYQYLQYIVSFQQISRYLSNNSTMNILKQTLQHSVFKQNIFCKFNSIHWRQLITKIKNIIITQKGNFQLIHKTISERLLQSKSHQSLISKVWNTQNCLIKQQSAKLYPAQNPMQFFAMLNGNADANVQKIICYNKKNEISTEIKKWKFNFIQNIKLKDYNNRLFKRFCLETQKQNENMQQYSPLNLF